MESKKSRKADLERLRPAMFALALIVSAALFVVALELDFSDGTGAFSYELLEDVAQDMELAQPLPQNDMAVTERQNNEPADLADNLNIIDGNAEVLDYAGLDISSITIGDNIRASMDDDLSQPADLKTLDQPLPFRVVESVPQFPGGMSAFVKWLTKHLKYPATAQKKGIEGRVIVSFIVNKDGSISDEKIVRNADKQLDSEALRVIKMMPNWKPGMMDGKPCRTMVVVPVMFAL